ncbi:MAG: M23 family metallopeptidase [Cytophagales bacterium]|nr:MAG: M23 family metallopeptidase [Cytophagales bacterium]
MKGFSSCVFSFLAIIINLNAQTIQKGYFQYPFNPGTNQTLSGSMGELRSNHFHGGIDVRTSGTIGLPILAAADGYVSKIIVTSYSYGNTIQITHPNGFITHYAHLDKFYNKIANYTREAQYNIESFEVELNPSKDLLLVKKGDTIGLSGNTGASRGPHLHFEIRDAKNKLYNPLLWGFPEIKDNIAPVFNKIAIRTFDKKSRINDGFGRTEIKPILKNGIYKITPPIQVWGNIGIEIQTYDKMNLASFMMGISYISLRLDNKEIFQHDISTFNFEENKYINVKLDYETLIKKGLRFERCYIADGDKLSTYKNHFNSGKINISDQNNHSVEIVIADIMGNKSILTLNLQGKRPADPIPPTIPKSSKQIVKPSIELFENILKISSIQIQDNFCRIYSKGKVQLIYPDYFKNGQAIYLYDMRKGVADSLEINEKITRTNYIGMIPSGKLYTYILPHMKINFPADALFDTLYTTYEHYLDVQKREVFQFNDQTIPLFSQPTISLTPTIPIENKSRTMGYQANRWPKCEGGTWEGNTLSFKTKYFGKFTVLKDTIPPIITPKPKINNTLYFLVSDGQSGIESFRATLDGKWLLMNFDHKRRLLWSEVKEPQQQIKGDFVLEVKDKSGNIKTFSKTY